MIPLGTTAGCRDLGNASKGHPLFIFYDDFAIHEFFTLSHFLFDLGLGPAASKSLKIIVA